MKKITLIIALAFFISSNAQNVTTNGTILLDDATSRTRVVVDAFLNSSNRVHELIEEIAPFYEGDFTTNNTVLVNTIETVSPKTSLAPATNYTDEVAAYKRGVKDLAVYGGYAPWNVTDFPEPAQWKPEIGYWEAADYEFGDFWYFRWKSGVWEFYDTIYPDEDNPDLQPDDVATNSEYALSVLFPNSDITITRTSIYVTNGAHLVTSEDQMPYLATTGGVVTGNIILPQTGGSGGKTTINGNGIKAGYEGFTIDSSYDTLVLKGSSATINFPYISLESGWDSLRDGSGYSVPYLIATATNDLHKSLAPTISNTVTKAYVEDLGIESGISAETATNIASTVSSNAVANADTTYRRTIGLTNLNQSVQYVSITDTAPTTLSISMPTNGVTKDWIVYVSAVTNVTLSLPSVTGWMADIAYTNDVPPATPTALWFSQVSDGIFILGRQELTEVTAP
jgi:hypothetical protein